MLTVRAFVLALPLMVSSVRLKFSDDPPDPSKLDEGDGPSGALHVDRRDDHSEPVEFDHRDVFVPATAFKEFWRRDYRRIALHAGIYRNKTAQPEFAHMLLLTTSNSAYSQVLQNWRCGADKLGLDYIVVTFDEGVQKEVGPGQGVLSSGATYPAEQRYREGHYNEMTCMKLEIVKEIIAAGFDVAFSDADNVFVKDPFARGVSLGDMIRSGHFDYIYEQDFGARPTREKVGREVNEGNTGFYYVTGSRKRLGVQALFAAGLEECRKNPKLNDQNNFWAALRHIRNGLGRQLYGFWNFACTNHCRMGSKCLAMEQDVLSYCPMDPFQHTTGWTNQSVGPEAVTYHANYCAGIQEKIKKIDGQGFWDHTCAGPPQGPARVMADGADSSRRWSNLS